MTRLLLGCLLFLSFFKGFSQEKAFSIDTLSVKIDSLYREDQFYAGLFYNSIVQKPAGLSQDKISFGFDAGFLRDFPLNKNRTIAFAPGIGLSFNNYIQNMTIQGDNDAPVYSIVSSKENFGNRFEQLRIEVPIEFRWRNSNPVDYRFFRIYTGFKFSYLLYDKSIFDNGVEKIVVTNNKDFTKMLYGVYLSTGYGAFNLQIYYGLNSLFKSSAKINSETIVMNNLSLGVIFYIL